MAVRLATWNLERGGRTRRARVAQEEVLRELAADVLVLTEAPAAYRAGPGIVASMPRRSGTAGSESWVVIVGPSVEALSFDVPYERMAVAARAKVGDAELIIYGGVLPWLSVATHASDVVAMGEDSLGAFKRVLDEQIRDVRELRERFGDLVLWVGDFNQTLIGPLWGGSAARRALLVEALHSIGYSAWNESALHAKAGMCAVDFICGPAGRAGSAQGRIDPSRGALALSDHAGYWVELGGKE